MKANAKCKMKNAKVERLWSGHNFEFCILNLEFVRFNLVGAIGVALQLALLTLLTRFCGLNYLWATGLAVSVTLLHNFVWHERFTFYDRLRSSKALRAVAARFLKFNLLTGLISIGGNVLLMHWLRGHARLSLIAANAVAIVICGIFNYAANDRLVFRGDEELG